jgi:hypothetical protein
MSFYAAAALTSAVVLAVPTSSQHAQSVDPGMPTRSPAAVPTATAAPAVRRCGPEPATSAGWRSVFDPLSGVWAGGDGASSTRLPDGRLLWVFGDTYVGGVTASGGRSDSTRLVRNSVVVTTGTCVAPLPTVTDALPGRGVTWLWPTHAVLTRVAASGGSSTVTVFAQRMRRTGPDAYGFRRVGTATVSLTVPWRGAPVVGAVQDLPASATLWGAAAVRDGAVTWIYGTRAVNEELVFGRDLVLARAPTATVSDPSTWSYRTATGWSRRESSSAVIRPARLGVSTVPSALRSGHDFLMVTKPQEFLDDRIVILRSPTPWGPWTARVVARAPSTRTVPRYSPAFVAPASGATSLVVVVSRTTTTVAALHAHAAWTRPTFVDVRVA